MKTMSVRIIVVCILSLILPSLVQAQVGAKVSDFRLPDATGVEHSLQQYLSAGQVVVLQFWSFKCPISLGYDERLVAMQRKYQNRGVKVLAIASNANESPAEIQRNASSRNLPFPILIDRDGILAERLGATHTPAMFVVSRDGVLRYRGAMDNNKQLGESGRLAYAEDAIDAVLAGQTPSPSETKIVGCSIKGKAF
jgi:peroxiredoxin